MYKILKLCFKCISLMINIKINLICELKFFCSRRTSMLGSKFLEFVQENNINVLVCYVRPIFTFVNFHSEKKLLKNIYLT